MSKLLAPNELVVGRLYMLDGQKLSWTLYEHIDFDQNNKQTARLTNLVGALDAGEVFVYLGTTPFGHNDRYIWLKMLTKDFCGYVLVLFNDPERFFHQCY